MGDFLTKDAVTGGPDAPAAPSLTPARWQEIKEIFSLALERDQAERALFVEKSCGGDEFLRAEVESLLASAASDGADTVQVFKAAAPPCVAPGGDREDPMLGRRIGDYRIESRIGLGGMAAVYLASRADDEYSKRVAIKILRPELDNDELLKRVRNERQTLAALDHPNIVKLLDGGRTDVGLPYLVMDYVEGEPIDGYCDSHSCSIQERLRLFLSVCQAVAYAHEHHVIHRDLKPSNIFVTADGSVKLLDFGIAKVVSLPDLPSPARTQTANRHLTPAYASPEQVRGEVVTAATDVYSLGVVLYGLLTGHRPYNLKERTPAAIERAICEQEPESPSTAVDRVETETRPDGTTISITAEVVSRSREGGPDKLRRCLRGDLDNIVLMALQKDPKQRYVSVADFAEDIRRHLNHRPIQARPRTWAYRTGKFIRRHKTEMIAALAVILVLATAAGFTMLEERRTADRVRAELAAQRARAHRSVAVLGFHNLSGRPENAWISTALAEMLNTELSGSGKLRAIPGEDIAQMKLDIRVPDVDALNGATLSRIHKNLGSDLVVVGSYVVLESGGERRVRVDMRLQDAILGDTLVAVAETGAENDLADVVDRAGTALREKLGVEARSSADSAALKSSLPANPEAMRFYSEGLASLRKFDVSGARDLLEKAVIADPRFALAHSALADAYSKLGNEADFRKQAKQAFDLSAGLPREQALLVQARYFQSAKQSGQAVDTYRTLFNFFPGNLEYGLGLALAQMTAGKPEDSLQTIQMLRNLPSPDGEDPRIDLAEANAATYSDYKHEADAARKAAAKADILGRRLLAGRARINEGRALTQLGASDEAIVVLRQARELLSSIGDRYGEALALKQVAAVFFSQDKFEDDRKALEESLHLLEAMGNRGSQPGVLNNLANALMRENKITEAKQVYLQSLAISREIGKPGDQAAALANLAIIETSEGDLESAAGHFQEALVKARESGYQAEVASVLDNLAPVLIAQGRPDEAAKALQESIQLSRRSGEKKSLSEALINQGSLMFNRDGPKKAGSLFTEALRIAQEAKNDLYISHGLSALASVSAQEDNLAQARSYDEQSLSLRQKVGDGEYLAMSWLDLAQLDLDEGSLAQAETLAKKAAVEFHEQRDWEFEARAKALLAEALTAQARLAEAQNPISSAREWAAKTQDRETRAIINIADARYLAAAGNFVEARRLLLPAVDDTRRGGFKLAELQARLALGEIELQSGDYIAARAQLISVERDANAKGFTHIARKAAVKASQATGVRKKRQ